jgi:hypothetical protein
VAAKDPNEFKWKPEATAKTYKDAKKRYSAKMNDKDRAKLMTDVAAAGGTYKELSDEEVAAKESDTKPPTSKELGTVLKETGKKPKAKAKPAEMPKTEMKPKAKGGASKATEKPTEHSDPIAAAAAKARTKKLTEDLNKPEVRTPLTKPTAAPATTQVPRSDSSGNTVDLGRFKGTKKMDAITDAAEKENQDYLNSDEGKQVAKDSAEARSLMKESSTGFTPGPGMSEAQAAEGKSKAETAPIALDGGVNISKGPETASVVDDDGGMPKGKKSGGPYVLNTDKTGKGTPVTGTKSQAKGTAAMNRIRRDRDSGLRGFDPTTAPEGRGTPGPEFRDWSDEDAGITKSSPTASAPAKGGMGARLRGFFGGHDSAKGSPLPTPSAGPTPSTPTAGPTPSTSTSSPMAPSFSRSQHFQGGHTVNQQGMGGQNFNAFNDNAGGASPASSGSGSINNNYATIQANTGDGNTYGNVKGATINSGPTVASTAGRATSANKNANVLSTGGPATQTNPRAQNATGSGRPTTSKKKNPRTEKP